MEIAETLRDATKRAQKEDELPDYLATRIFAIADLLPTVQHNSNDIEKLTEQVTLYDTYGQTGYLGMGVNHIILEKTIRQIEEELKRARRFW
ncbi:MAG: hypothetical protein C0619_11925 [Desulfuromonas sp.]|nr:MAG: hypothetical protein C0619_11925 [Desulfuromonas sp.]